MYFRFTMQQFSMVGGYMEDLTNTKLSKLRDGRLPGTIQYTCVEEIIGYKYI